MSIDYAVQIVWSEEDNCYLATPAELSGCVADGATQEEALSNLRVIVKEWLEVAKEEGRPVPKPVTIREMARMHSEMQKSQRQLFNNEVKKAVSAILKQISQQQEKSHLAWSNRISFGVSPNLEEAGFGKKY